MIISCPYALAWHIFTVRLLSPLHNICTKFGTSKFSAIWNNKFKAPGRIVALVEQLELYYTATTRMPDAPVRSSLNKSSSSLDYYWSWVAIWAKLSAQTTVAPLTIASRPKKVSHIFLPTKGYWIWTMHTRCPVDWAQDSYPWQGGSLIFQKYSRFAVIGIHNATL